MTSRNNLRIFVVGLLTVLLFAVLGVVIISQASSVNVTGLMVTNVSDSSASVVWVTDKPVKGTVQVNGDKFYDDRDVQEVSQGVYEEEDSVERYTHHVTIRNLEPNQTYEFEIKNGWFSYEGENSEITTASTLEMVQSPDPVYGRVRDVEDGIVVLRRANKETGYSQYRSVTINAATYSGDVANILNEELNGIYDSSANDLNEIQIWGNLNGAMSYLKTEVGDEYDQPVSDIDLGNGQQVDFAESSLLQNLITSTSAQVCNDGDTTRHCDWGGSKQAFNMVCNGGNWTVQSGAGSCTGDETNLSDAEKQEIKNSVAQPTCNDPDGTCYANGGAYAECRGGKVVGVDYCDTSAQPPNAAQGCPAGTGPLANGGCDAACPNTLSEIRNDQTACYSNGACALEYSFHESCRMDFSCNGRTNQCFSPDQTNAGWIYCDDNGNEVGASENCANTGVGAQNCGATRRTNITHECDAFDSCDLSETCGNLTCGMCSCGDGKIAPGEKCEAQTTAATCGDAFEGKCFVRNGAAVLCQNGKLEGVESCAAAGLTEARRCTTEGQCIEESALGGGMLTAKCIDGIWQGVNSCSDGPGNGPNCGVTKTSDIANQCVGDNCLKGQVCGNLTCDHCRCGSGTVTAGEMCNEDPVMPQEQAATRCRQKVGICQAGDAPGTAFYCTNEEGSVAGCPVERIGQNVMQDEAGSLALCGAELTCDRAHITDFTNTTVCANPSSGRTVCCNTPGDIVENGRCVTPGGAAAPVAPTGGTSDKQNCSVLSCGNPCTASFQGAEDQLIYSNDNACESKDQNAVIIGATSSTCEAECGGSGCTTHSCDQLISGCNVQFYNISAGGNLFNHYPDLNTCQKDEEGNRISDVIRWCTEECAAAGGSISGECWEKSGQGQAACEEGPTACTFNPAGCVDDFLTPKAICDHSASNRDCYDYYNGKVGCGDFTIAGCSNSSNYGASCEVKAGICVEKGTRPGGGNRSELRNNLGIFTEVSAQENLDTNNLEPGVYEVQGNILTTNTLEVKAAGPVRYFYDNNSNGVKDEGEEYLTDEQSQAIELDLRKVAEVENYNLSEGWSLIHVPMVMEQKKASELITRMNEQGANATHLTAFRNGKFIVYSQRVDNDGQVVSFGDDFNILPGEGYFVRNYVPVNVSFRGNKIEGSLDVILTNGWNLVGLYNSENNNYTGFSALNSMQAQNINASVLSKWENGNYYNLISEEGIEYGSDFQVFPNAGYWVKVNSDEQKTFRP